jgi:hypothetical protein
MRRMLAPRPAQTAAARRGDSTRADRRLRDEPLRLIVYRMADKGVTRLPVVSRADRSFIGMLALNDLLGARARILDAEQRRERVLGARLRLPTMFGGRSDSAA